jgi:hypothetical protein
VEEPRSEKRRLLPGRAATLELGFVIWCALWTLVSASAFYRSLIEQTGGEWSAPLDDVFIHFDYAKATALGHPFEWVPGNGYSSGNTSLSYPFVLAFGWLVGFRELSLMAWAAWVACLSVFGVMLAVGRVTGGLARWLAAPFLVGIGALAWSLWSGMEVAFFLAVWAAALVTWNRLVQVSTDEAQRRRATWQLAGCGVLLVVTRPESLGTIAVFALVAALTPLRALRGERRPARERAWTFAVVVAPAIAALVVQSVANRALTGEWSANGAIVKLAVNSPYLSWADKLDDWRFNVRYCIFRCVEYHFSDDAYWGQLVVLLALAPLGFARTRRLGLVLWLQIIAWIAIVALNGQVRWQNERYVMPAVAWLMVLAAMGVAAMVDGLWHAHRADRRGNFSPVVAFLIGAVSMQLLAVAARTSGIEPEFGLPLPEGTLLPVAWRSSWIWSPIVGLLAVALLRYRFLRAGLATVALAFAVVHQLPKMRDQRWFFGRASRNIRDQHVVAGRWLASTSARRILVGDAGALVYLADKPGLDIIGLGGYHRLPFARASVHGLAASLELIERMSPEERPDVFAIYPSWWGVLSTWFTRREVARFPVVGNVICGGSDDVVYEADWHLLGTGDLPVLAAGAGDSGAGEASLARIVDTVDVADLVSEKEHGYRFTHPNDGWTDMKILADTTDLGTAPVRQSAHGEVFDGGRRFAPGGAESFTVHGLDANKAARLVIRTAPEHREQVAVVAGGRGIGQLDVPAGSGWVEAAMTVPAEIVGDGRSVFFQLQNIGEADFVDYHVWIEQ